MKFLISILLLISLNCFGQVVQTGNPVGSIMPFLGSAAPQGYLIADGSCVSKTTYAKLFAIVGTTYGSSCAAGLFKLPDLRELVLVGAGTNNTNAITAHDVYTVGQFKDDQFESHKHYRNSGNVTEYFLTNTGTSYNWVAGSLGNVPAGQVTSGLPVEDGVNILRTGSVTRTKQIGVNYIIKY